MPKIVDRTAQRREIREAALRVFSERGLARAGLAHVAAAVGMGRSSLYHYYPTKDSLVRDLARELLRREEALFEAALRGAGPPLDRIVQLSRLLAALFGRFASEGRLLLELWASEPRRVRPVLVRVREHLATLIREGQRSAEIDSSLDPHLAAGLVIGMLDGVLIQSFLDPNAFADLDALADAVTHAVRRMLRR